MSVPPPRLVFDEDGVARPARPSRATAPNPRPAPPRANARERAAVAIFVGATAVALLCRLPTIDHHGDKQRGVLTQVVNGWPDIAHSTLATRQPGTTTTLVKTAPAKTDPPTTTPVVAFAPWSPDTTTSDPWVTITSPDPTNTSPDTVESPSTDLPPNTSGTGTSSGCTDTECPYYQPVVGNPSRQTDPTSIDLPLPPPG